MPQSISPEDLMRFIDGELPPSEHARVEAALASDTELNREVAIYRGMKGDFQELSFDPGTVSRSVWDTVNVTLTRPVGWFLVIVGVAIWTGYGAYLFTFSTIDPFEKLATGGVVIGILILLASIIWERYREWLTDPYRDVYR